MYYRLIQDDDGGYEKDGMTYSLSECNTAYTPQGLNVGYTYFSSREEAIRAWGLSKVIDEAGE